MRANRIVASALLAWGLLMVCLVPAPLWARRTSKPRASAKDQQVAATLLASGSAALVAKNLGQAKIDFEDAFRKNPAPEVLFQLGKLAEAEGRLVVAQDILRRYLHETAGDAEGPEQKEAQRVMQLAAAPSGEVSVFGARGAWVLVDDRLAGALPLPLPLLLETGNHRIIVELGDQRIEEQVKALPGQTVEMRFNQKTGTVVVSVPPALVLLLDGDLTAEQQKALTQAVSKAVARERQAVVPGDKALKLRPSLGDCLQAPSCLTELGNVNEALYVLRVRASRSSSAQSSPPPAAGQQPVPEKSGWKFAVEVFDPSVGDFSGRSSTSCDDCAPEQALQSATTTVGTVLQQAASRSRGAVEITSQPPGADVFLAGEKVGVTPYKASRFVGSVPVEVRLLGRPPYTGQLNVEAGQVATVAAQLTTPSDDVPEPSPTLPPPPPKAIVYRTEVAPRPKWRLALGGSLIGAGAVVAGFGVSALSVDGNPAPCLNGVTVCRRIYDTKSVGRGLVVLGVAAVVGGVVTIALPGPKRQVQVAAALSPESFGMAALLHF